MAVTKSMNKEKVIKLLEYYKDIDGDVKIYKKVIQDYENQYYNPMGAIVSDGLPKGKNNISRQTENMAMNIPDSVREEMRYYGEKICALQELKAQILREISRLEYKKKSIVFDFYIHGLKWERVAERNHYSERQCKNIRNIAIENLTQNFQNNRFISKYEMIA